MNNVHTQYIPRVNLNLCVHCIPLLPSGLPQASSLPSSPSLRPSRPGPGPAVSPTARPDRPGSPSQALISDGPPPRPGLRLSLPPLTVTADCDSRPPPLSAGQLEGQGRPASPAKAANLSLTRSASPTVTVTADDVRPGFIKSCTY
jgi:hypothetical protein